MLCSFFEVPPRSTCRVPRLFSFWLLFTILVSSLNAQVPFRVLDREVIEARLRGFSLKNSERESILGRMFQQSGCTGEKLQPQVVRKRIPPNLICVVPGETDRVILVGAHSDHADIGDGVVDNWSGASLLPSLMYSLAGSSRKHTFLFVAFADEEGGMSGSEYYAKKLSPEQRAAIDSVVNLDTLGLGPTKIWGTHSDKQLVDLFWKIADYMKIPVGVVNVEQVGSTDSESFAKYGIPRITIHSVTQETWKILHSRDDNLQAIKMDDYYSSYRLLTAYLAMLDTLPGRTPAADASEKPKP